MKKWLRRLSYLLIVLFWLLIVSFPFTAFALAVNGRVQVGRDDGSHLRLFMVQQPDADGVAAEVVRPTLFSRGCRQTTIVYLLWEGEGENARFCQCFDPETGSAFPVVLGTCNADSASTIRPTPTP